MFKSIKEFFFGKPVQAPRVEIVAPYRVEMPVLVEVAVAAPVVKKAPAKKPVAKAPAKAPAKKQQFAKKPAVVKTK